ncbi:MAG TPA: polyribonucleotide nucleotidyltransferase [bacterium]|nr:polyribonucleotide nucleotidyltransferase [bacterium]
MMDFKEKSFSCDFLGKKITVKTGKLAQQVDFSCTVQYGDTVILATVNMAKEARPGIDFFPLMVDYEEKLYAAGKIKGSRFIKREGQPTEDAVLIGRMIDRGLRPLFPETLRNDVQLVLTVLSYDESHLPDVVAIIAGSIALHCSSIPWNGPVAGIRVGRIDNEYKVNLSREELTKSDVNLVVTANKEKVLMVDADFNIVDNTAVEGAFAKALQEVAPLIDFIEDLRKQIGKEKVAVPVEKVKIDDQEFTVEEQEMLSRQIKEFFQPLWSEYLFNIPVGSKSARKETLHHMIDLAKTELVEKKELNAKKVDFLLNKNFMNWAEEEVTKAILDKDQRVDGRALNQIRTLEAEVALLPRPHGSALFRRGETQILSIVTLGAPGAEQTLDTMEEDDSTKRYMHHYNFAPYSVGEIRPLRGVGRREIGHGALAEKALLPVLPPKLDFPYTIRVVSETLGSNGSSSMASTCGSSLSLMAAGVPIKEHVAGVAIGLASDGSGRYKILTDIQDLEDGKGGMDFKVTGTRHGVTAIQMDTKTDGLTIEMVKEALARGIEGRNQILDVLEKAISQPAELSKFAPRILSFSIDPEKIGEVIGPGGKIIKKIVEETKVDIDIDDDGSVFITSDNAEMANRAKEIVLSLVKVVQVGDIYEGKVSKLFDFGVMVKILPQKEGMIHISELEHFRVNKVTDVLNIGDTVKVIVKEIDNQGRVNLSRKALLPRPDRDSK